MRHLPAFKQLIIILLFLVAGGALWGQSIQLPHFFSDHMVVQRDRPIRLWGSGGTPGQMVRIQMHNRITVAWPDSTGRWVGTLGNLPAGGPYDLLIQSGVEQLVLEDVMVGEVWICAGQSNLEFELHRTTDASEAIANANYPGIRYFEVPRKMSSQEATNTNGGEWKISTPQTAAKFSGVAYHFAKNVHERLGIAVGIVEASWGGTAIDTWQSSRALADDPEYEEIISMLPEYDIEFLMDSLLDLQKDWRENMPEFDIGLQQNWQSNSYDFEDWPQMVLPRIWESGGLNGVDGVVWFKRQFELTAAQAANPIELFLGKIDDEDQTYVNGELVGSSGPDNQFFRKYTIPANLLHPGTNTITVRVTDYAYVGGFTGSTADMKLQQGGWVHSLTGPWYYQHGTPDLPPRPQDFSPNSLPCLLFNGMIAPFRRMGIRGMVWYQGESDTGDPYYYRFKQLKLVDDWRQQWLIGDFPFLIVQMPNFRPPAPQPAESSWATLRESQAYPLVRPKTEIAVTIDVGEPYLIHPPNKATVGERLSLAAMGIAYGQNIPFRSPGLSHVQVQGNSLLLTLKDVGGGMQSNGSSPTIRGFAVAGLNGQYHWADAELVGPQQVRLTCEAVPQPRYVRYAWSDNPGELQLYSAEGLPLRPFRTDSFSVPWQ